MCRIIQKNLIINKDRRIGNILIVVEGESDEHKAFENIFGRIFGYSVNHVRGDDDYVETIYEKRDCGSIYIANTRSSSIKTILDGRHRDAILTSIKRYTGESLKNFRTYYVWDRDNKSNTRSNVEEAIAIFCDAQENNETYEGGLITLSYPCYEAYQIANFVCEDYIRKHPKDYISEKGKRKFAPSRFSEETIKKAAADFLAKVDSLGVEVDLDNAYKCNFEILEHEEEIYSNKKEYLLLSEITMILLDLNIITVS